MKKLILVAMLTLLCLTGQSQILITLLLGDKLNSDDLEFGLEGGVNWTNITGMDSKAFDHQWNLGFYFDIRIKNQWFFYTGVLVKSNMGLDKLSDDDLNYLDATIYTDGTTENNRLEGDYSQKLNYFLVPALAKYKFRNNMYFEAGPQFGLMYNAWIQFDLDVDDRDAIIKEYNKDKINRLDAGIMAGLGYTLLKGSGWTLGAKYYYGLANVYKGKSNAHNNALFLKLNIPIGAGKKKEGESGKK